MLAWQRSNPLGTGWICEFGRVMREPSRQTDPINHDLALNWLRQKIQPSDPKELSRKSSAGSTPDKRLAPSESRFEKITPGTAWAYHQAANRGHQPNNRLVNSLGRCPFGILSQSLFGFQIHAVKSSRECKFSQGKLVERRKTVQRAVPRSFPNGALPVARNQLTRQK